MCKIDLYLCSGKNALKIRDAENLMDFRTGYKRKAPYDKSTYIQEDFLPCISDKFLHDLKLSDKILQI